MSAERGWIGDPQPPKEWHTPGWVRTGGRHFAQCPVCSEKLDAEKLDADTPTEDGWMTGAPWIVGGRDER